MSNDTSVKHICDFCHLDDTKFPHRSHWDCERALKICIEGLRADNARMRGALAEYLDKGNWLDHWCSHAAPDRIYRVWIGDNDGPELARKALEGDA